MRFLPLLLLLACGKSSDDSGTSPLTGTIQPTSTGTASGTGTGTGTGSATGTGTGTGTPGTSPWDCAPLPTPTATVTIAAGDVSALVSAVNNASPGDVILLEDGTWDLDGAYLWIDVDGVTLQGASGDSANVILDGGYVTTEIITIAANDVTVAHLTTRRAWTHGIHATGGATADVTGAVIYDVAVMDPGEQAIKVNQTGSGTYTDDGVIACSHLELTDAGRPSVRNCYTGGIDSHATRGWSIRDNYVAGFWCESGLSEHGIHLWRKNAETVIERNVIENCARGIGLGLSESPGAFDRDHGIDCGPAYVDDVRSDVWNNKVFVDDARIYASGAGFDVGIGIWNACEANVVHNTVYSTQAPYSSIEWRFDPTSAYVANNLVSHNLRERTVGVATVEGNIESAGSGEFVDAASGNLHLAAGSSAVDAGVATGLTTQDIDGATRDATPDVGADEL